MARLLTWVREHGSVLEQLDRKSIGKELERDDLLPAVRRALELRLGGAQAAVKKLDALSPVLAAMIASAAPRYHGASTGRWAGEGYQPQNLKRAVADEAAIAAVATGDYAHVRSLYPQPLL